jgi:hypothetical protein
MMVARVWQRAGLKPHRIECYVASDDPDFELKAADVIGLYVKPPQHAAVFCVDEKTAIQALDRLDPVCHYRPGGWSATALNTIATAPFRCTPRLTRAMVRWWAKPPRATPARSSWPS